MTGFLQKSSDRTGNPAPVAAPESVEGIEQGIQDLKQLALKHGADDAVVISAADVILDPRVRFKCMIPRCYMSGSCGHCPPHGYSSRQMRSILAGYDRAVFFRVRVSSAIIAADHIHQAIESGVMDPGGHAMNLGGYYILVFSIVKILQKRAEENGCRTHGFAAGNCRDPFCHLQPVCRDLMTGRGCRHPNLSSHSMESTGMDVYRMAARAGWEQYPIGGTCLPESVPHGSLMGLVLVGPGTAQSRVTEAGEPMKKQPANLSARIRERRKNIQALRQMNMTPAQMMNMFKEPRLWFRVTRNFRDIEGAWFKALKLYAYMFEGVPDKKKRKR